MIVKILLLAGACSLPLLNPGDTPWINDEPLFIYKALQQNNSGVMAADGLRASSWLSYGPMAVWFYALLLKLTHNPIHLIVLRILIFSGATIFSCLWLSRISGKMSLTGVLIGLLSFYYWIYARLLWDNTFLIPLGSLAFAAYAAFNIWPSRWCLWFTALPLIAAALIHPMIMPLVLAIVVHAIIFQRPWLHQHRTTTIVLITAAFLISVPWFTSIIWPQPPAPSPWPAPTMSLPLSPPHSWYEPFVFPFLGARLFSSRGIEYFLGDSLPKGAAALSWVTLGAYVLVWAGILITLRRVKNGWAEKRSQNVGFHVGCVACLALLFNWILGITMQLHTHPHYYNGMWICFLYFAWSALNDSSLNTILRRTIQILGVLTVAATAITLMLIIIDLHVNGGNQGIHFGATIANQIEVAKKLGKFHPDSPLKIDVDNMRMFPHALPILGQVIGATGNLSGERRELRIRYRDPADTGWITVDVGPVQD